MYTLQEHAPGLRPNANFTAKKPHPEITLYWLIYIRTRGVVELLVVNGVVIGVGFGEVHQSVVHIVGVGFGPDVTLRPRLPSVGLSGGPLQPHRSARWPPPPHRSGPEERRRRRHRRHLHHHRGLPLDGLHQQTQQVPPESEKREGGDRNLENTLDALLPAFLRVFLLVVVVVAAPVVGFAFGLQRQSFGFLRLLLLLCLYLLERTLHLEELLQGEFAEGLDVNEW
jgi:hypothetical protein